MTPGIPRLVHCPHCNEQVAQPTLNSGNTFGAVLWSDARQDAPMLPHYPDLIRCPHCNGLFLASTATEAKNQPKGYSTSIPYPPELSEDNWLNALDSNLFTGEDEQYGRIEAWHAANDSRRGKNDSDFQFSERAVRNLEALRELFAKDNTANALLLTAEIHRELKRFDDCLTVLGNIPDGELGRVRDQIKQRAQNGDASIFELKFD